MKADQAGSVDEYIAGFAPEVRARMEQVRAAIRQAAPHAEESIRYQMPSFGLGGRTAVYFAGYKKHIGFYPTPVNAEFQADMAVYGSGKGTAQFPHDKPLPLDLVTRVVQFWMREAAESAANKGRNA